MSALQWGRDPRAADSSLVDLQAVVGRAGFNGAATQGPRIVPAAVPSLRRAPGFNGAATQGPRIDEFSDVKAALVNVLQWGRDPRAADSSGAAGVARPRRRGFNGAATQGPRIGGGGGLRQVYLGLLQWGRDPRAADSAPSRRAPGRA